MPPRTLRPCSTPGCPELTTSGRCAKHTAEARARHDATRGTAAQRGYDARWARRAKRYLATHPTCVLCGARSQVPDHHPSTRRELIAQSVADPDADPHLRPLCIPCHNSQTAKATRGGVSPLDRSAA